jgi:hypothetical protein
MHAHSPVEEKSNRDFSSRKNDVLERLQVINYKIPLTIPWEESFNKLHTNNIGMRKKW